MDHPHEYWGFVKESAHRFAHLVVSKVGLYGKGKIRMDVLLIDSDGQHRESPLESNIELY